MKKRLSNISNSNFIFALKIHFIICIISFVINLSLNFVSSSTVTVITACLYFLSGIFLLKRNASLLSLFSVLVFIYLLGLLIIPGMLLFEQTYGILLEAANFLNLFFSDPLQVQGILPLNLILVPVFTITLPFFPILLMFIGKKAFRGIDLTIILDNWRDRLGIFRKVFYVSIIIVLSANVYYIYNPKLYVDYYSGSGFEGYEESVVIGEDGDYNYIKTNYQNDTKKKIKLKLTKGELRQLAFNIVYKNMFFKLRPDLSLYFMTDQARQAIKVKWFGKTKEVYGYGIINMPFYDISSNIIKYYRDSYKYGYIDKNETFSIYPKYSYATSFIGDYAYVYENYENFWIDKSGIVVSENIVSDAKTPKVNLTARMQYGDKYGFINNEGKYIITPKYQQAQDFSEGLAAVRDENDDWVYINEQEQKIIKIDSAKTGNLRMGIDDLSGFHYGLAWIKWNNKYGYIDKRGQMVIQPVLDVTTDFSEGLACVKVNNKWGYINVKGKYVVDAKFDMAFPFSEGLGCVRIGDEDNGKWGYIDKTGKFIIDTKFSKAEPFSNGMACVMIDLIEGEVDKNNTYILKKFSNKE